ncbi:hypothetical protein [Metabacillus idriensis]|nr:hypothetical protein [Metabacillus idriensis]
MAWLIGLLVGALSLAFAVDVRRKNTFNKKLSVTVQEKTRM